MNRLVLFVILLGLLSSCEVQKRRYTKGFYVSFIKKQKKNGIAESPAEKTQIEKTDPQTELVSEKIDLPEKTDLPLALVLPSKRKTQKHSEIKSLVRDPEIFVQQKSSFIQRRPAPLNKIDRKAVEDSGFSFAIFCFSAFLLLCLFGWIFRIMLAGLVFMTLIFLLLLIIVSGASIASIVKSLKHIFTSDAAKMGLAIFAIILASIVLISFFSLVALFFVF